MGAPAPGPGRIRPWESRLAGAKALEQVTGIADILEVSHQVDGSLGGVAPQPSDGRSAELALHVRPRERGLRVPLGGIAPVGTGSPGKVGDPHPDAAAQEVRI